VDVKVGNGNVIFRNLVGSSWVDVGNGGVVAKVLLPPQGVISYQVGNGGVDLWLKPDVSASFSAKVGNGTINVSGLPLSQTVSAPRILQGILGSGAGIIDLSVGNGGIRVQGE
jgi:hypothetical protein